MDNNIPKHVAIIMDGNGRWATNRGLKRSEGHKQGSKTLEKLAIYAINSGVKYLSVYAFSTDNFKRTKEEVDYLMNLFILMFKTKFKKIDKENIKVVFSGRKEPLNKDVLEAMNIITEKTKNNTKGTLNICLNYGGQEEIVDASKKIIEDVNDGKVNAQDIDKELFYKYLYQDLPPIDLLIRTSGEYRVSNFMLYQMSYSEFYFTDVLFPDFDENEFNKAIDSFNSRERRFGKNK
ncbi:MAG: di-trans,poly-cis-decaprenylcistransferase [Bacilli bacterium]|nr:di-trans,poly-cis-decaprenylcistransferase [Bacilli bacterium]